MNRQILDMIDAKHIAHRSGNKKFFNKLKKQIAKAIKESRAIYSSKIQERLATDPADAWSDIKKLSGLPPKHT